MTDYLIQFCGNDSYNNILCYNHRTVKANSAEQARKFGEKEIDEFAQQYFENPDRQNITVQAIALSNINNGKKGDPIGSREFDDGTIDIR